MTRSFEQTASLPPEANLAELREIAMHLAACLRQMMPGDAKKAVPENGHVKPLPLEFDLLLGHNKGVIDGLDKLSNIIIRLTDKERELRAPTHSGFGFTEIDELDLERRIFAELDRVAEQKRKAIVHPQDLHNPQR